MPRPPPCATLFPYTTLFRSRPPVHRVDANDHAEKIRALRNLINARLTRSAFSFHAHFAGAGENLARDQKWQDRAEDRKSTRLNSSHRCISYAVFCLKKKNLQSRRCF